MGEKFEEEEKGHNEKDHGTNEVGNPGNQKENSIKTVLAHAQLPE